MFLDGGAMFGVIPKPLWEKKCPADARNRIELAMNCLLIRAAGKRILVETGAGEKLSPKLRDIYGLQDSQLLPRLREYGLAPEDIDIVIDTHLHFDHCGGNTRIEKDKAVANFPNAQYIVQKGEYEHALHPTERDRASYFESNYMPLREAGQLRLLEGGPANRARRGSGARAWPHRQYAVREADRRREDGVSFRRPRSHDGASPASMDYGLRSLPHDHARK